MIRRELPGAGLARRPATRQPNKRIHILCEGLVTEPEYLNMFFRSLSTRNAVIGEIRGGVGVPKTIVEQCILLKNKVTYEARKSGFRGLDEVWAVFDVDEHDLKEALPLARKHSIKCAISNPCIEIWGLFHHREVARAFHRHDAQRELSRVMPDYDHKKNPGFNWDWCRSRYLDACVNASRARANREKEGSHFPKDVPSSNFDRLLAAFDQRVEEANPATTWSEWMTNI